jgi:hypothetical protein
LASFNALKKDANRAAFDLDVSDAPTRGRALHDKNTHVSQHFLRV